MDTGEGCTVPRDCLSWSGFIVIKRMVVLEKTVIVLDLLPLRESLYSLLQKDCLAGEVYGGSNLLYTH